MSTPMAEAVSQQAPPAAAPLRLPPAPRRVSGPSRGHPRAARAQGVRSEGPLVWVLDHPWLDRLVRGRTWIAIVAVALLAIVAVQVALLRLGSDIGAVTTRVNAQIQSNETARTAIAALQSGAGVRHLAVVDGLVEPAPSQVRYLDARAGDALRAAARMHSPSAAAIAAELANRHAAAAALAPARHHRAASKPAATGATGAAGTAVTGGTLAATATPSTASSASTTPATTTTPTTTTATTPPPAVPTTTTTTTHSSSPPPISAQGGAVAPTGP